ncbi:hypothetical protein AMS68_005244 [Peltaster fructicola]|uniref:HORMA domain-containing protein n=1 Tax=Peltaster fructicola TaxID=286661 RepID=A0A6H0XY75_9PEZI|nr:hypothetical protein AMS68_005244 [Peltaster fructicola]
MASDVPLTFRALVVAFTDFLTVAVHTILYERSLYPRTSFVAARKYNFAVRQNRHPKVCEWINDAVTSVEVQLLKSAVDRIAVVIYDKSNTPLERFLFDVSPFPIVPEPEIDTPLVAGDDGDAVHLPVVDMEEQFRAVLSRLSNCAASLQPIPQGCTFTIAIELKGSDHHAPIRHPQAWIPVAPETGDIPYGSDASAQASKAIPIRAMAAGELAFDAWIEETRVKPSSTESDPSSQSTTNLSF